MYYFNQFMMNPIRIREDSILLKFNLSKH